MTDKTKSILNKIMAGAVAVGAVGYVLTGGTEAGALNIVSVSALFLVALTAVIGSIKG